MRRLVLFLAIVLVLFTGVAVFDWWIDPFGQVWKPDVLQAARTENCLVGQELIGDRYWSFKHDVFSHRPTRSFVVGSIPCVEDGGAAGGDELREPRLSGNEPGIDPEAAALVAGQAGADRLRRRRAVLVQQERLQPERRRPEPWKELEYLRAGKMFTRS